MVAVGAWYVGTATAAASGYSGRLRRGQHCAQQVLSLPLRQHQHTHAVMKSAMPPQMKPAMRPAVHQLYLHFEPVLVCTITVELEWAGQHDVSSHVVQSHSYWAHSRPGCVTHVSWLPQHSEWGEPCGTHFPVHDVTSHNASVERSIAGHEKKQEEEEAA